MLRRLLLLSVVVAVTAVPASALAIEPEQQLAGASSKWFSGELASQTGLNCSTAILGDPYTEIMVQGLSGFGGAANGAPPTAGAGYWTVFTISVPGNPCGPGSSLVATDLILPDNTVVDTARGIRCFGLPRNHSGWEDITNQSWSLEEVGSGPYCPTSALPSIYQANALSFGSRLIASGQLFKIFVPVKTSQPKIGITSTPPDGFYWLSNATGVYANPGLSRAYTAVLPGGGGSNPQVFFSRPPATPFWQKSAPAGQESRVELFVNLYTAELGGTFCPTITRTDLSPPGNVSASCALFEGAGWGKTIPSGQADVLQIVGIPDALKGPNGGWAPVYFDQPGELDKPMRITWTYDPDPAGGTVYSGSSDFRTLAGPDNDGDGVVDALDACPATSGTLSNGCLPAVVPDPDKDGIYGAQDLCPDQAGTGFANGCPGGVVPAQQSPAPPGPGLPAALGGTLGTRRGATLKRVALGKGIPVPVTCTRDAQAQLRLTITKKVAKALRLKAKGATLTIASGRAACTRIAGAKPRLKLTAAAAKALRRPRAAFKAVLVLGLTAADKGVATSSTAVKVG